MILYLTGNEHFLVTMPISDLTKSEKGGWVNGLALCPAATSCWQDTAWWPLNGLRLTLNYPTPCSSSCPQSQYSCHVQCCEAACYTRLSLDDLLGTCKKLLRCSGDWAIKTTSGKQGAPAYSCDRHVLICNGRMCFCPVGSYYSLLSHCRTICPIAQVRWTLDGPDSTVCLAHMPFFAISAVSSEAVWGKGHPSTKWSKPPHWKHLQAEVLTVVALRMVAIRAWSVVVKGQLWSDAHCTEPNVVHLNCRPDEFFVLLHDKVSVVS